MTQSENNGSIQMIKVICLDNGKTIDAELYDVKPTKITVILPGFQKLTLNKSTKKPDLYTASQFGMEFSATYRG